MEAGLIEYGLIALVVALTSSGQVLQKLGADRGLKNAHGTAAILRALFRWEIILSGVCLASAVVIWLAVLYRMDVSKAFPFISSGFIVVLLAARFYLREAISWRRWIGVLFIVAGISLLSQS
jgi:undecaprenyl phosphate-alpha-L-ara4N flippase subunit ArnE